MAADQPGGARRASRILNIVHHDEIWKDHIRHEHVSARHKWPETWGYLVYEYKKLNRELEGRPLSSRPDTATSSTRQALKLPVIPKRQSSFPRTTNQEIGWKSTQDGRNADMVSRYGEERRGKTTIFRRLNWPKDGIP